MYSLELFALPHADLLALATSTAGVSEFSSSLRAAARLVGELPYAPAAVETLTEEFSALSLSALGVTISTAPMTLLTLAEVKAILARSENLPEDLSAEMAYYVEEFVSALERADRENLDLVALF